VFTDKREVGKGIEGGRAVDGVCEDGVAGGRDGEGDKAEGMGGSGVFEGTGGIPLRSMEEEDVKGAMKRGRRD
jgi:hypothetical protein